MSAASSGYLYAMGRRAGKTRLTLTELARLEVVWAEERRLAEIERLRAEGKTDEAFALALNP